MYRSLSGVTTANGLSEIWEKEQEKSMNRDEGSYQLCHIYDKMFAAASIISHYWGLFSDEFLHFNCVFQPLSLFNDSRQISLVTIDNYAKSSE